LPSTLFCICGPVSSCGTSSSEFGEFCAYPPTETETNIDMQKSRYRINGFFLNLHKNCPGGDIGIVPCSKTYASEIKAISWLYSALIFNIVKTNEILWGGSKKALFL
jgi:hypothetical protein